MTPWFADTYYYLAFANPRDHAHVRALELTRTLQRRIVTTEFVLLEVADAMYIPESRAVALRLLQTQRSSRNVEIIPASSALLERGLARFAERVDKDWPLTDCISFVVMEERSLEEALTGDHHFEQAGFRALMK